MIAIKGGVEKVVFEEKWIKKHLILAQETSEWFLPGS